MRRVFLILFIGNSLTSANDLPRLVCEIARDSGREVVCESVTFNNFSLNDHLKTERPSGGSTNERGTSSSCSRALPRSTPAARKCFRSAADSES